MAAGDPVGGVASATDLKRQANEAAARHSRARSEYVRLESEVVSIERQVGELEQRMVLLRQATTRGAAALYKRDSIVDSVDGFGDGDALLGSARRMKLVGEVNELAGVAVQTLDDAARHLRDERRTLDDRRRDQEQVVARIAAERRAVEVHLAAMAKAERAASRARAAAARTSRMAAAAPPEPRPRAAVPGGSFICPINGPVAFSDDFGGRRNHKGNDLMSPRGTENVAVVAGTIETRPWRGGGITIFLRGDDGHTYIYMHLLRIVGPIPRHVEQGEVIGLTGATGNATAYHTHFEFHPGGGAAVNPYPLIAAHC